MIDFFIIEMPSTIFLHLYWCSMNLCIYFFCSYSVEESESIRILNGCVYYDEMEITIWNAYKHAMRRRMRRKMVVVYIRGDGTGT